MASPDAKAYPHSQPAIELTIPYYLVWTMVSIVNEFHAAQLIIGPRKHCDIIKRGSILAIALQLSRNSCTETWKI